ncbi:MAG: hypothetical protein R3E08_03105 [Thiotrichaceae bacterium]
MTRPSLPTPPSAPSAIKPIPAAPPPTAALPTLPEVSTEHANLLKYMNTEAISIEQACRYEWVDGNAISSMLLILELRGMVKSVGGLYMRIK